MTAIVDRMRAEVFDTLTDWQASKISQILMEEIQKGFKVRPSALVDRRSFLSSGTKRINLRPGSDTSPLQLFTNNSSRQVTGKKELVSVRSIDEHRTDSNAAVRRENVAQMMNNVS